MDELEAKDEAVILNMGLPGGGDTTEGMCATTDDEKTEFLSLKLHHLPLDIQSGIFSELCE